MVSKVKTTVIEGTDSAITNEVAIQGGIADQAMMASYDVLKRVGRVEAMDFLQRVTDLAIAKTFEEIKNSKQYKGLPYTDQNGKLQHVTNLEEFCQVFLGKKYSRCQQLAQNLNLLGEELYEQAEQIGFTARDYQALKALPADDQAIVKQAIETEDKEHVIDLLQEMAVKHKGEKEALKKQLEDTKLDLEASRSNASKKEATLSKTENELEKLKVRIQKMTPAEIGEQLREEATRAINRVEVEIRSDFYNALKALFDHQTETGVDHAPLMTGFLTQIKRAVNDVAIELDIQESFDENPIADFLRTDADQTLEEATRKAYEEAGVTYEE